MSKLQLSIKTVSELSRLQKVILLAAAAIGTSWTFHQIKTWMIKKHFAKARQKKRKQLEEAIDRLRNRLSRVSFSITLC